MDIKIRLEKDEDGVYVATCPSLPGCISQGQTEHEAIKNIKEAIKLHLRCLAEDGLPLAPSDSKIKETLVKVNI